MRELGNNIKDLKTINKDQVDQLMFGSFEKILILWIIF